MFRACDVLQKARLDKEVELVEISKKTKIPEKYLQAIESQDKSAFPQEPYCSLIVKDYANYLGLNGDYVLSLFYRDFEIKHKTTEPKKYSVSITPQITFFIVSSFLVLAFISYLGLEYYKFNRPPPLKVEWPELSETMEVSGITEPEANVRVNDDLVIVDSSGKFKTKVSLNSDKKIIIEAKSPIGKISKVEKTY